MQGGEEARSGAYLLVRCNDERPHPPFERGLRSRKLWGEVRKGGVPPSEESLRRDGPFSTACKPMILSRVYTSGSTITTTARREELSKGTASLFQRTRCDIFSA
jgi:hypothetical protein